MLNGSLKDMPLPEVLRLLSASGQSGCLILHKENPFAFFYLKIGQVSHCESLTRTTQGWQKVAGIEALSKACSHQDCMFRFDTQAQSSEETLLKYPTAKLIDSIAQFIEKRRQLEVPLPSLSMKVAYQSSVTMKNFKASQEELSLFLLANGKRTLKEIAAASNLSELTVQQWASKFMQNGILAEEKEEELPIVEVKAEMKPELKQEMSPQKPVRYWRGKPVYE